MIPHIHRNRRQRMVLVEDHREAVRHREPLIVDAHLGEQRQGPHQQQGEDHLSLHRGLQLEKRLLVTTLGTSDLYGVNAKKFGYLFWRRNSKRSFSFSAGTSSLSFPKMPS